MNPTTQVRIPCKECNALILPATASHTGGLCMQCFKRPQKEKEQVQYEKDSKDRDLLDCGRRWFETPIAHKHKVEFLDEFRDRYIPLISFFGEHRLFRDEEFGLSVHDWYSFELRRTHLTEEGVLLYQKCVDGWLKGLDRGTKPTHMARWSKTLREIRESSKP